MTHARVPGDARPALQRRVGPVLHAGRIMHGMKKLGLLMLAAMFACAPLAARECTLRVRDAWVRLPPGNPGMLAGYARLENECKRALVVTGARSPAFGDVSVHETRVENGMSRMRPLPKFTVPAGGSVLLAPGGRHLMLMMPTAPLEVGRSVEIRFDVEGGAPVPAHFVVRPMVD